VCVDAVTSLDSPQTLASLADRLSRLAPDSVQRWGRMSAHEMLCHLADSFRAVLGEREISSVPAGVLKRRAMRFGALHTPLPWPKGLPTMPEVDAKKKGTPPGVFEADRTEVVALLRRFAAADAIYAAHPAFGAMPRRDWMIWGYRHMDHHLRQFGL